jgi:hypothetical protein
MKALFILILLTGCANHPNWEVCHRLCDGNPMVFTDDFICTCELDLTTTKTYRLDTIDLRAD